MRLFSPFALIVCSLLLGGCDRFADETRSLEVRVVSESGANVRLAEVHVVLNFTPEFPLMASLPVSYSSTGQNAVKIDVTRRSDGARFVNGEQIGLVGPGEHEIDVAALPLPNGLYTLRVLSGTTVLNEEVFVINRVPAEPDQYTPLGYTGPDGRVTFPYETLSVGTDVVLQSDSSGKVARSVDDEVTLWIVPRNGTPQAHQVALLPVGTTRTTVTVR